MSEQPRRPPIDTLDPSQAYDRYQGANPYYREDMARVAYQHRNLSRREQDLASLARRRGRKP